MIIKNIRAQTGLFRDINDDDPENDIREAFRCFDKDALGYIPVPSKINRILLVSRIHKHWMLWSLFHLSFAFLDPNCYIFLHCTDLTHILETLGERMDPVETEEMMLLADEDGDGNINYEEFISMLFKVSVWKCVLIERYFAYLFQRPHSQEYKNIV